MCEGLAVASPLSRVRAPSFSEICRSQWQCDVVTSVLPDATSPGRRLHAHDRSHRPLTEGRYRWARAYRDGELVCGRVELTVRADFRLGLAPHERRYFAARFLEHPHPGLRSELTELVRRRGAAARRAAERMQPVEIVFEDPQGARQRVVGWVQPPQLRRGDLDDIEFALRAPAP
jgi:hypothetical protein